MVSLSPLQVEATHLLPLFSFLKEFWVMLAVLLLLPPLTASAIHMCTKQAENCCGGKLTATAICKQRGCTCISKFFFLLPHTHWPRNVLFAFFYFELLSNCVCNYWRRCFHLGLHFSPPSLSSSLHFKWQGTSKSLESRVTPKLLQSSSSGVLSDLCPLLKPHFHCSCSSEVVAQVVGWCR